MAINRDGDAIVDVTELQYQSDKNRNKATQPSLFTTQASSSFQEGTNEHARNTTDTAPANESQQASPRRPLPGTNQSARTLAARRLGPTPRSRSGGMFFSWGQLTIISPDCERVWWHNTNPEVNIITRRVHVEPPPPYDPPGDIGARMHEKGIIGGRCYGLDEPGSNFDMGYPFLVLGIFSGTERVPGERILEIRSPHFLFWQIWAHIVWIRGVMYFLSLKDVRQFRIYKVRDECLLKISSPR
jgi:hypothetical protein